MPIKSKGITISSIGTIKIMLTAKGPILRKAQSEDHNLSLLLIVIFIEIHWQAGSATIKSNNLNVNKSLKAISSKNKQNYQGRITIREKSLWVETSHMAVRSKS